MGIFIDYTLRAEGTEEEVRGRLEAVRERCLDLPLKSVGEVRRIAPIYNPLVVKLLRKHGHALPGAIEERLNPVEEDRDHRMLCLLFAFSEGKGLTRSERNRYFAPAEHLMKKTDLWRAEDLPEKIGNSLPNGFTPFTFYRAGIEFEFASVLLQYGYLLLLHPGEGSETVNLALSTFAQPEGRRARKPPLWYGQGFTKTQYAKNFIQAHDTACRVMDILGEEGLLIEASDNCGYYASRSWKDAGQRVNEELMFAGLMGGMMGVAVGNLREEGTPVEVIEDNASKARPVDFSAALKREEAASGD